MFPLIDRNLPNVEHNIVSYLGSRDLVRAKVVCKAWHSVINRYINYLKVHKFETIKQGELSEYIFTKPLT